MHRGAATARFGIVKTGQVIVNQGGAMHEFNGHCDTFAESSIVHATCLCYCQSQLWPNTRTAWKHGMTNCASQLGRATGVFGRRQGHGQTLFDSCDCLHALVSNQCKTRDK
jgi:hypothetical protein